PPRHPTQGVPQQNHVGRHRRHHQLLDGTLELGAEKARYHVGIAVGDHRHHDQSRHDVVDVRKAVHLADAAADQVAEDDEIQRHGDARWQQRLRPDPGKTPYFLGKDGGEGNPAAAPMTHVHAAPLSELPSTRWRNSSSRRLLLLRRLSTSTSCAASAANRPFMPCSLSTCTSSVWSSASMQGKPGRSGACTMASRQSSRKVSTCNCLSNWRMLVLWMIRPPSM